MNMNMGGASCPLHPYDFLTWTGITPFIFTLL